MSTDSPLLKKGVTDIPRYGLKLKLNHKYPEKRRQGFAPRLSQLWHLVPLALRYLVYYILNLIWGRAVVMDYFDTQNGKQIYGVPIGGIGSGTIGRGYKGEFCRYQLRPGMYEYNIVDANQFIVTIRRDGETIFQSVLSSYKKAPLKSWKSLINSDKCLYTGLYPRSWTEYDLSEYGIKLVCRQVSPVIPHNYKDSSYPCAVFAWSIENVSSEKLSVTIAFTLKNGTGNKKSDASSTCVSQPFTYLNNEGVSLDQSIYGMPCTYGLGVRRTQGLSISKCLYFDPNSSGKTVWQQLSNNGAFDKTASASYKVRGEMAIAIAAQASVPAGQTSHIDMVFAWHMPVINFGGKQKKYAKYYTQFFNTKDTVLELIDQALSSYSSWENDIYESQKDVLNDSGLPDWYKSALFNESYFVSDGGTVWLKIDEDEAKKMPSDDIRLKYGRFAYLEGHEYRMYNTYDVHFYASYALIMNWPLLQLVLQYDMKDTIFVEIKDKIWMLYDGQRVERKIKNSVPHDVGNPGEEPIILPNSYPIHDVSEWRDLNTKFVLQVFRDFRFKSFHSKDMEAYFSKYLEDMFEACKVVMEKSLKFDIDDDGLIENGGCPDQTFDTWIMQGSSAYCGGLWLAALFGMVHMCDELNKPEDKKKYEALLEKGKVAYEKKLWNSTYYNFDCSKDERYSVMADQLCGHWYLRCCGFKHEVFPRDKVVSSLKTVYDCNVMAFDNGNCGAVNGFINNSSDTFTIQSEEVWTGVTYAVAAHMIFEDMLEQAWQTAGGLYKLVWERIGMSYETPEALFKKKSYRAIGYMRPLSIWSMQLAWSSRKEKK